MRLKPTQDYVLGYSQPSLRDWFVDREVLAQTVKILVYARAKAPNPSKNILRG